MSTPDTKTPEQWSALVADANESAGAHSEPDWAVAYVPGSESHSPWLWYVTLPMTSPGDPLSAFTAEHGAAPSKKAAVRQIQKHITEYDGRMLGRDPKGPTLGATGHLLLRLGAGLALAAVMAAAGLPGVVVWFSTVACVAGALGVFWYRQVRALDYETDR